MDDIQPLPILIRRKTYRVRGPRPCSWLPSSSDSSFNEHHDTWPWTIEGPGLCRWSTLPSTTSNALSDSSLSSSSSSPISISRTLDEFGEKPHYHHARRRKPVGPRAPHNDPCFFKRPRLVINTSLPAIPQLQRENSPTTPPVQPIQIVDTHPSSRIPPLPSSPISSPSSFLLDWDAIFEMLEC